MAFPTVKAISGYLLKNICIASSTAVISSRSVTQSSSSSSEWIPESGELKSLETLWVGSGLSGLCFMAIRFLRWSFKSFEKAFRRCWVLQQNSHRQSLNGQIFPCRSLRRPNSPWNWQLRQRLGERWPVLVTGGAVLSRARWSNSFFSAATFSRRSTVAGQFLSHVFMCSGLSKGHSFLWPLFSCGMPWFLHKLQCWGVFCFVSAFKIIVWRMKS